MPTHRRLLLLPALLTCLSASTAETTVTIKDLAFSPASVGIPVGGTVTWVNNDDRDHAVRSADGLLDSGNISPGARWSFTFKQAGTVSYGCPYHPRMRGSVTVK